MKKSAIFFKMILSPDQLEGMYKSVIDHYMKKDYEKAKMSAYGIYRLLQAVADDDDDHSDDQSDQTTTTTVVEHS